MDQAHIRNFAIIAHIDHGKSTLADRLMQFTGTVAERDMQAQLLDSNPIERERGITIKLAPVRMAYSRKQILNPKSQIQNKFQVQNQKIQNCLGFSASDLGFAGSEFILNLIDTPGHVDFGYEVSRSLAACEGAILVVDATQGVQAQTLANLRQARYHHLKIIPVVNKIDIPHADIAATTRELVALGFTEAEIIQISAKTGQNIDKVLETIIERIPPPSGQPEQPLRALVFSSRYDSHRGVVVFVRIVDGNLRHSLPQVPQGPALRNLKLKFLASGVEVNPIEVGYFTPKMQSAAGLNTGEVGYIATGLKDVMFTKIGDTITISKLDKFVKLDQFDQLNNVKPLPGYKEPKPMVFLGLFPVDADEFVAAREAMEKLRLSDSAFTFRLISSPALGNGFHCGFLGLLHAEVVQERILREFNLTMITTAPSVEYLVKTRASHVIIPSPAKRDRGISELVSEKLAFARDSSPAAQNDSVDGFTHINSAAEFPDLSLIIEVKEPVMQVVIFTPKRYVGGIMGLVTEKRGEYVDMKYLTANETEMTYLMPLSDMIIDFFDRLKSVTEGYASLDYEFFAYQPADVVKVDILFNHEKVDAFSFLTVRDQSQRRGREVVERLVEVIPRQQFQVPVQAAIGGQVIARGDIKAFRKDVIAKLYGGDRTRKDKLLKKQKKGKAKMKRLGSVEVPQSAFFEVLKRE